MLNANYVIRQGYAQGGHKMTNLTNNSTREARNFALNLYRLRTQRGMTRAELADVLGVTERIIFDYEGNQKFPKLERIILIADFFDVEIDSLFRQE